MIRDSRFIKKPSFFETVNLLARILKINLPPESAIGDSVYPQILSKFGLITFRKLNREAERLDRKKEELERKLEEMRRNKGKK